MSSIRKFYETQMSDLSSAIKNFDWEDAKSYSDWLSQTYYFVRHSTRLLMLAGSRFNTLEEDSFHRRFIEHTAEERGHEKMLLNDLKGLSQSPDHFFEKSSTQAFYQSQYYRIEHKTPFEFFGYILFLEGIAVMFGDEVYNRVVKAHGPKAATFLKVHAHEDPDHVEKAIAELEKLPTELVRQVKENYLYSQEVYINILNDCRMGAKFGNKKAS